MVAYSHGSDIFSCWYFNIIRRILTFSTNCLPIILKIMLYLWNKWKSIAEKIGNFQATIIFSFLYFSLVVPFGKIASLFKDFLAKKEFPQWKEINDNISTLEKLKLQ